MHAAQSSEQDFPFSTLMLLIGHGVQIQCSGLPTDLLAVSIQAPLSPLEWWQEGHPATNQGVIAPKNQHVNCLVIAQQGLSGNVCHKTRICSGAVKSFFAVQPKSNLNYNQLLYITVVIRIDYFHPIM